MSFYPLQVDFEVLRCGQGAREAHKPFVMFGPPPARDYVDCPKTIRADDGCGRHDAMRI